MKILIVTDAWYPQVNGVVRTYEYLRTELEAMGHDIKVVGPADFPLSVSMPGYSEIRLVLFPFYKLHKIIGEYKPNLLHIATEGPLGFAARKYCKHYGKNFTSCYHTHFPDYTAKRLAKYLPFLYEPVHKAAIRFVRYFHAPSLVVFAATKSLENTLRDWKFACPVKPMTRGIDHSVFHEGPKNLFRDLPRPVALYVGRVAIEKNLEAFLSMPWEGSKVIVGDGPDFPMLKKKYKTAHFAGVKTGKQLADHYRSADVFVFPSKTDTFGMVLVEALACGIPVAGYPVTGPADIITDEKLGAADEDLSRAAHKALQHGSPAERAEHAKTYYSWRKAANQFLGVE